MRRRLQFFPLRDEGQTRLSGDKFCPSVQSRGTIWGQSYGKKVIKKKLTQRKSAIKILRISLSIKSFLRFICRWWGFVCRRLFSDAASSTLSVSASIPLNGRKFLFLLFLNCFWGADLTYLTFVNAVLRLLSSKGVLTKRKGCPVPSFPYVSLSLIPGI